MFYFYGLLNCAITNVCNWTGQVGPERANEPIIFEHFANGIISNEIGAFSFHIKLVYRARRKKTKIMPIFLYSRIQTIGTAHLIFIVVRSNLTNWQI